MEHLPPPLFSIILAYAVYDSSEDLVPKARQLPVDSLKPLSLVCKSWNSLICDVVASFRCSTLNLKISFGPRSEIQEIRRKLGHRGPKIVDLRVQIGEAHRWADPKNGLRVDWDTLFARLPSLQRLDLSRVNFETKQVELILQSAAKFCKNVESVVLCEVDEWRQDQVDFTSVLETLYTALETWYSSGKMRGLRQLTVPSIGNEDRFQSCKLFFDNLIKICPGVEYVDGYKNGLNEMDKLTCLDDWMITLEQWEEFNSICTKLREFHWVVAPFADPFFRVFGEHVKPQLTKLTIAVNMWWNWEKYINTLDDAAGITPSFIQVPWQNISQRKGYGFKATDVSTALKGCPALDELEIELYHPVDENEYGERYGNLDDAVDFPDHEVLNIDIFGDRFCEALAKYNPLLTKFSIWEVAKGHNINFTPIRTFTDQGLVALAQLKYLTSMELRPINCTGNGVFAFLDNLSDEFMGQRMFQISVGGYPSDSHLAFYNTITELLMQLETRLPEELSWGRRKFVLRLMNSNFASVDKNWSEQYLRDLDRVVENVKKIHPTLRLRITTSGRSGCRFKRIIEFGLYTANAIPNPWYGWDEEESFFDDGFGRLPVELRHPELLDPDSLPIDYELPADYLDEYGGYGDYDDYGDEYSDEDDDGYYDGNADELWE